ncbi:MAG: site-specific DNA-methyltransferase [Defluviitaleaceae bacterium]|nr:site-specific DNA-methyltransferase [Defluviitaleaceae bacterium]
MTSFEKIKQEIIADINKRFEDKILEKTNADLLKKLINNSDNTHEALSIAALGTTYKRTGFHFDKRIEKMKDDIKYFKKSEKLSFKTCDDTITHKLIIGDNYDALLNLQIEYRGKIDVIYIDPPYGKDRMGEFAATNYDNAITRDNLLSMLYPRLVLAKQLLSDTGLIFCSIDDKNHAYVKGLFDDIFSEANFVNSFVWQKNSSVKTEKDKFTINTEYILLYSKTKNLNLNDVYKELAESTKKTYSKNDNDGRGYYTTISLQKPRDPGPETTYDYIDNNGKKWPCPAKGWRMKRSEIKKLENDGRLYLKGKTLRVKDYWDERANDGKRADTLWNDIAENSVGSSELKSILMGMYFDNPKPTELIKRCLSIATKDAIVLDFFAGSGTTGQAVLELNESEGQRQFILVTSNEITETTPSGIVKDVTSKRLKRIMTGSCYDGTDDFKWLDKNKPLGNNLDVYDIFRVANFEATTGKTPFDVIDETLYGQPALNINDKIKWVCENFEGTQRTIENDTDYKSRIEGEA